MRTESESRGSRRRRAATARPRYLQKSFGCRPIARVAGPAASVNVDRNDPTNGVADGLFRGLVKAGWIEYRDGQWWRHWDVGPSTILNPPEYLTREYLSGL